MSALADPVLKEAMGRAMETMRGRRAEVVPPPPRFEELRAEARAVKERVLDGHAALLAEFAARATEAGAVVVHARDGAQACDYITGLARERGVSLVTKSKSMTSEEIGLNAALQGAGVAVVEGDLGERIIQLAGERPSHLVAPAIHKSREAVISLLSEKLRIAHPPQDAEGLTKLVREALRPLFLSAGMGITGANFAVAETGSLVLVENEGNICLTSQLPPLHVAVVGSEKLVPALADLAVFLELLPPSATGQRMPSYVSLITGRQRSPVLGGMDVPGDAARPAAEREFHLVILDNGRSRALQDRELREALMCIRCGACLNACAPYTLVGGHVYGGDPYPGGIGCVWTYITKGHAAAWDFAGLCTTCSRCTEVCPVKIDIPWLNTVVKQRANRELGAGMRQRLFARTDLLGRVASPAAPLTNRLLKTGPARAVLQSFGIDASRGLPTYERETFLHWWARHRAAAEGEAGATRGVVADGPTPHAGAAGGVRPRLDSDAGPRPSTRVALFVDCFTNHNLPQVGRAAVRVLERAGVTLTVAHTSCCGRPAMSQGLLQEPRRWAAANLDVLTPLIERGWEVVCVEPSCLSALRDDYRPLLENTPLANDPRLALLERHVFEISEYLMLLARAGRLPLGLHPSSRSYVVHGHCHQKSLGIASAPADLVRLVPGVTVHEVEALCCGMVGSFGYKAEYAPLSRGIGEQLLARIAGHEGDVVTCGISCRTQIAAGSDRRVLHPVEVLAAALK